MILAHLSGMPHIHAHDAVAALVILFALGLVALAAQGRSK